MPPKYQRRNVEVRFQVGLVCCQRWKKAYKWASAAKLKPPKGDNMRKQGEQGCSTSVKAWKKN